MINGLVDLMVKVIVERLIGDKLIAIVNLSI